MPRPVANPTSPAAALGDNLNDKAAALKHAEIARERAYCDGPPHCYKKALDTAEKILAKLRKD